VAVINPKMVGSTGNYASKRRRVRNGADRRSWKWADFRGARNAFSGQNNRLRFSCIPLTDDKSIQRAWPMLELNLVDAIKELLLSTGDNLLLFVE
jgi:hypothetical protein